MEGVLKASYGDKEQRAANAYRVDPVAAAHVEEQFKARRAHQHKTQIPGLRMIGAAYQPPYWDAKHHGQPYGAFRPRQMKTIPTVQVEIRPGVMHEVAAAPEPRPPSPAKAKVKAKTTPTLDLQPEVSHVEQRMRRQLKKMASVHETEKTVLLKAFAKVMGKRTPEMSLRDKVSVKQFMDCWKLLDVVVSPPLAAALFAKYGHDHKHLMPVTVFVEALMMGGARLLMMANEVKKGAFRPGGYPTLAGKIVYPQCKTGVWAPSDWNPKLAERSAQLPDVTLSLEFVYGYDGMNATSPNMFYSRNGEVVYYTAAVCVVYDQQLHRQRFFLGHDDDILCLAMHPDRVTVASGQFGKDPHVLVWDSETLQQLAKLQHGYGFRGVQAVCFSPDGAKLASVATDNSHSIFLWNWKKKEKVLDRKTQPGAPPSVYGVTWSPFHPDRLVTFGQNHMKFWTLQRGVTAEGDISLTNDVASFLKGRTHSVLVATFLPSGLLLTGNNDGQVCVWKGSKCVREVGAHAKGNPSRRPDGTQSYSGVRSLVLGSSNKVLFSGGGDGYVIKWDVSSGDLGDILQRIPLIRPDQVGQVLAPAIRALDCRPGSDTFIAGSNTCDIWEVDQTPEILIYGHPSDLSGVAMNPAYPHVFATFCGSDKVHVLSAVTHKPIRIFSVGMPAVCGAFTPNGKHLAVGMKGGGIKVMDFYPELTQVWWGKPSSSSIDVLRYSPDGNLLAAGSHDQTIHILDVRGGYVKLSRCRGHSSAILHFDWCTNSKVIQSNDQAYEVLHFDARAGQQVKQNQRDTEWGSWSCVLGFPVMGIWPPGSDGTDINSCDRSPSKRYLLTADDFGKVRLLNCPCVMEKAPGHTYPGHSSHVTGVRWGLDETYAVSVGGHDRSVFQWRLVRKSKPQPYQVQAPYAPLDPQGVVWGPK